MKKSIILILITMVSTAVYGYEIEQRSMSSEPEVKLPTYLNKMPKAPDEPFDRYEQYDIDRLEVREPSEPYLLVPFEHLDRAYDIDINLPPMPEELKDSFPRGDCPNGMQCEDPSNNLLHEPPYRPGEPYIREMR